MLRAAQGVAYRLLSNKRCLNYATDTTLLLALLVTIVGLQLSERHVHDVDTLGKMNLGTGADRSKLIHVQIFEAARAFPVGRLANQTFAMQVQHGSNAPMPEIFLEPIELGTQSLRQLHSPCVVAHATAPREPQCSDLVAAG